MVTSTIVYKGELSTTCRHEKSGSEITTDAPTDNNGLGRTFSPTDLLATALGSCMLTIMGIRANESGFDISESKAEVQKIMTSDPRRVAEVQILIMVKDRGLSDAQKRVLEKAATTCPVAMSLSQELKQTVEILFQ